MKVQSLGFNEWLLRFPGQAHVFLTDAELDSLAQMLAFRLNAAQIVRGPGGVCADVGGDARVHLCFTDEVDEFVRQAYVAAGNAR